jgi:hypothetical protein
MEHPLGDAIPAAAIPDGLRIEPWSDQNDEEFRFIRNESFKDHWGSSPMPVDAWKNKIINHTFRPEVSFLLRDVVNGAPAGMLVTCTERPTRWPPVSATRIFMLIGTVRNCPGLPEARRRQRADRARAAGRRRPGLRPRQLERGLGEPLRAFGVYEKAGFAPRKRFVRWALEG